MNAPLKMLGRPGSDDRTLVTQHQAMVRRIAMHMADRVDHLIDVDDLMQIGFMGLLDAAKRYDAIPVCRSRRLHCCVFVARWLMKCAVTTGARALFANRVKTSPRPG